MKSFDEAFVEATVERLGALAPDTAPQWGVMRPPQLLAHLTVAVSYSLNKQPLTPNEGGFLGRYIAKPLIFNNLIPLPKNAKRPKFYDAAEPAGTPEGLRAECLEFIQAHRGGTLPALEHPFFGPLDAHGWATLHRIHFGHHLRQFGINL